MKKRKQFSKLHTVAELALLMNVNIIQIIIITKNKTKITSTNMFIIAV